MIVADKGENLIFISKQSLIWESHHVVNFSFYVQFGAYVNYSFYAFLRWQWSLILQTSKQFIKILGRFSSHSQVLIEICLLTAIKMYFRFCVAYLEQKASAIISHEIFPNENEIKLQHDSFLIYQAEFIINWINFMSKTSLLNNFLFSFCNLILAEKNLKFNFYIRSFYAPYIYTWWGR